MKKIGTISIAIMLLAACNNSATEETTTDTTTSTDNTRMSDTGAGSVRTDTTLISIDTIHKKDTPGNK
jgi:hypothetical protein